MTAVFFNSCNDMKDFDENNFISNHISDSSEIIVLNEGLFNLNNSSITKIDFSKKELIQNYFQTANNRGLGDTGNDLILYNNLAWTIINVSSQLEIFDPNSGISIRRIPVVNSENKARQPRYICSDSSYLYLCSFDGNIDKIDPVKMEITSSVQAGKNPDGICTFGGRLYISNSGGLDAPDYDSTVTVLQSAGMSFHKTIRVGLNPGIIHTNSEGKIYLIVRGNPGLGKSVLKKINPLNLEIDTNFPEINASYFSIYNDTIFAYNFNQFTGEMEFFSFDTKTDLIIQKPLLSGNFNITTPYSIAYNPNIQRIYITDAQHYTTFGSILCFDKKGEFLYRLDNVGLNPAKILFIN